MSISRNTMVTLATVAVASALLAGCNPPSVEEKLPESLGNATAPVSPAQDKQLGGQQVAVPAARGLVAIDDTVALLADRGVLVGTPEQFAAGAHMEVDLPQECYDLTAGPDAFVVACADGVYLLNANDPTAELFATDAPISSAVQLSSGEIITAAKDTNTVTVHRDGETPQTITVEDTTDALVRVGAPTPDEGDRVYRINREFSLIQTVEWEDNAQGAVLRAGLGVADIAPGEGGMALTTDAIGGQFGVYTDQSVIRLQQTTPLPDKPWAVAWDSGNQLVWLSTPGTNQVHAYRINSGKGEVITSVDTVTSAQHLAVLADGRIVIASADGGGLHIISSPA